MGKPETPQELEARALAVMQANLGNREWRLANLYQILKGGNLVPWEPYEEQLQFRRGRANRNFVPKARKLGLSTEIVIENGDECVWTQDLMAGIIDKKEQDAWAKLQIFRLAWERGPDHPDPVIAWVWCRIHAANPLIGDSNGEMAWSNGAVFRAGTSFTGRTPQRLHISEYGPIAALYPAAAAEIQRGSINSVEPEGIVDIETTMEGGRAGLCYHYFKLAKDAVGKPASIATWKLHFFSWLGHPLYRLPGLVPTLGTTVDYFRDLHKNYGLTVPLDRQAWWESRRIELRDEIWQQYPTVIEEVDKAMVAGMIYPEMTALRVEGRVTAKGMEIIPGLPLFTSWDLGSSDNTAGWLLQPAGRAHNVLAWCCGEGQGAAGVAEVIRKWEAEFGPIAIHLLPHDANIHDKGSGKTYLAQLIEALGATYARLLRLVPRTPDVWAGIGEVRKRLSNTWFHERCDAPARAADGSETPSGVMRLEGYRKRQNASTGLVTDVPVKDGICDHTADALRTYCEADALGMVHTELYRPTTPAHDSLGRPKDHVEQIRAKMGFSRKL